MPLEVLTSGGLEIFGNYYSGTQTFAGHIIFAADNTYDIGSATASARNLYFDTAVIGGSVTGDWKPDTDGGSSIGTSTYNWLTLNSYKSVMLLTPAVTAASQTLNAAPTAKALTAANTKSFTGTIAQLALPSITPAANGGGITMTGVNVAQGAISNVADSETITVKPLVITGAAGAALETGVYTWTGIDITVPAQAANNANNAATGLKITGGTKAGGASAYQRGIDIAMAGATDDAIYISEGNLSFGSAATVGTTTGDLTLSPTSGILLLGSNTKVLPTANIIGFSVVTGLTLGSVGSVVIPAANMTDAANDAARDGLVGDKDGAVALDTKAATFRFWGRYGGAWKYVTLI